MGTDPGELYPQIAQIAAVFAGFGSLASSIGNRSGGADARIDAYRIGLMLFASLSATLLGLLPATLVGLSVPPTVALRVSAGAAVVALLVNVPLSTTTVVKLRNVAGFNLGAGLANTMCILTALAGFALCALGMPADRLPGVYLLGLMCLLGSSIVMFSRVIASLLRPHSRGEMGGR
jgi:hypothetical protein